MALGTFQKRAEPTGQGDVALRKELRDIIMDFENSRPRTMQKAIGPSEIGHPCVRRVAYKLAGFPEPESDRSSWLAIIGTASHNWLADALAWDNERLGRRRWLIETHVRARYDLDGSGDAYDLDTDTSVDWKVVGKTNHTKYRVQGPGSEYRVQGHVYGLGHENQGRKPKKVAIAFLPRFAEIDAAFYVFSEPYDRGIALRALERKDTIQALIHKLNPVADPQQFTRFPRKPERNCMYCPWFHPQQPDPGATCPGNTGN